MNGLKDFGYKVATDKSNFDNVFNGKSFKEIHIDTYANEPYQLFSRVIGSNIKIVHKDGRIVLTRKDGMVLADVLYDGIYKYAMKKREEYYQFVLTIQNIWYKILIVL